MPRNQERTRVPNISQLAHELGFTDAKFLSKMLMDFWSISLPNSQFADISDEQVTNIASDFLEKNGREIWSQKGRGPVYPDEKDTKIKPKLIAILKRQRRNQFDVRIKKVKKLQENEDDEVHHPECDRRLETPEGTMREVNELGHRPQDQASALSSAQPAPSSAQLLSPRAPAADSPLPSESASLRSEFSDAPQSLRSSPVPAGNPRKRAFEDMSGPTLHGSRGTSQVTTAHKRTTPENAGLTSRMESKPMPYIVDVQVADEDFPPLSSQEQRSKQNGPAQRGYTGPRISRQGSVGDARIKDMPKNADTTQIIDDGERRGIVHQGTLVQRIPRATNAPPRVDIGTTSTAPFLPNQSSVDIVDRMLAHAREKTSLGAEVEASDRGPSTPPQAERFSYFALDNTYSIEADKALDLFQWLLEYCDEKKNVSAKTMREATTAEDKSSARSQFLLFRELLHVFKEEGLRGGARLEL